MVAFRLTQKTMGVGRCSASPLNQTGHQVIQPHHQHHQQQQPRRKIHPLQRGHIDLSPSEQQAQLICHALSPTVRQKQKQNYKWAIISSVMDTFLTVFVLQSKNEKTYGSNQCIPVLIYIWTKVCPIRYFGFAR